MVRMSINYTRIKNTRFPVYPLWRNFCYFANDARENIVWYEARDRLANGPDHEPASGKQGV